MSECPAEKAKLSISINDNPATQTRISGPGGQEVKRCVVILVARSSIGTQIEPLTLGSKLDKPEQVAPAGHWLQAER